MLFLPCRLYIYMYEGNRFRRDCTLGLHLKNYKPLKCISDQPKNRKQRTFREKSYLSQLECTDRLLFLPEAETEATLLAPR